MTCLSEPTLQYKELTHLDCFDIRGNYLDSVDFRNVIKRIVVPI